MKAMTSLLGCSLERKRWEPAGAQERLSTDRVGWVGVGGESGRAESVVALSAQGLGFYRNSLRALKTT